MSKPKKDTSDWLGALSAQGLKVKSANEGLETKGFLDSGNYALNWAMSGRLLRGYPLGHTVEIFGDPSTGKSLLVARAMAMAQRTGGVALLDDTEGSYNLDWIGALGVDPSKLAYRRSRTVKEHFETARGFVAAMRAMKHQGPGVLACDSLSLLSTEHELEVGLDKRDMSKAGELRAFFRLMGAEFVDLPVVHISASHVIANIGNMFQKRTTSGGGGPKYQASIRLDLRTVSKIKNAAKEPIGVLAHVVVDKNRVVAPWKEVRIGIPFVQPISPASGLIPLLVAWGVVEARGQFLYYRGTKAGRAPGGNKDDTFKQDEQAEALLDRVPELLEETDVILTTHPLTTTVQSAADVVEGAGEEEGE
jgi:recombination protein RecA